MTKGLGLWLLGYGVFLFLCGAVYFLLYPNQAPTPVLAGAITGGIASFLGVLLMREPSKWVVAAVPFVVVIFMMFGLALSMQQWMLVKSGQPEVIASCIATAIFLASAAVFWRLKRKA